MIPLPPTMELLLEVEASIDCPPEGGEFVPSVEAPYESLSSSLTNASRARDPCLDRYLSQRIRSGPPTSTHRKNGRLIKASRSPHVVRSSVTNRSFHRSVT